MVFLVAVDPKYTEAGRERAGDFTEVSSGDLELKSITR